MMVEKYDSERDSCFPKRLEKQTGLGLGPQNLGGLFMENHSRKKFSLLVNFSGLLHHHSHSISMYSLQPANHPLVGGPINPHLLTLNKCVVGNKGESGNLEFVDWGSNCQSILNFRRIPKELARGILTSFGFPSVFGIIQPWTLEDAFRTGA